MLTLNAATAKMLSEIPAEAQPGEGAHGMAAVARASTPAARQTRKRAAGGGTPRCTNRSESQPPRKPPQRGKYRRNPDVPDGLPEGEAIHVHHV